MRFLYQYTTIDYLVGPHRTPVYKLRWIGPLKALRGAHRNTTAQKAYDAAHGVPSRSAQGGGDERIEVKS